MYRSLTQGEPQALVSKLEAGFRAALGYDNERPVTIDDMAVAREFHNLVRDIEHEIASRANHYNALWAMAYGRVRRGRGADDGGPPGRAGWGDRR